MPYPLPGMFQGCKSSEAVVWASASHMSLVVREVVEDEKSRSVMRMLDELTEGLLVMLATSGLGIGQQYSWKDIWSMGRCY